MCLHDSNRVQSGEQCSAQHGSEGLDDVTLHHKLRQQFHRLEGGQEEFGYTEIS